MKKMTLVLALLLCLVMSVLPLSGCKGSTAPGGENVVIDTSKTQLYVRYYAGGLGTDWLEEICSRFEEDFANVSFEEGKTGVQIVPKFEKTQVAADQIRDNNSDVFFMEHMSYSDAVNKGFLLNISDVVKDYAVTGYDGVSRALVPPEPLRGRIDVGGEVVQDVDHLRVIDARLMYEHHRSLRVHLGVHCAEEPLVVRVVDCLRLVQRVECERRLHNGHEESVIVHVIHVDLVGVCGVDGIGEVEVIDSIVVLCIICI